MCVVMLGVGGRLVMGSGEVVWMRSGWRLGVLIDDEERVV